MIAVLVHSVISTVAKSWVYEYINAGHWIIHMIQWIITFFVEIEHWSGKGPRCTLWTLDQHSQHMCEFHAGEACYPEVCFGIGNVCRHLLGMQMGSKQMGSRCSGGLGSCAASCQCPDDSRALSRLQLGRHPLSLSEGTFVTFVECLNLTTCLAVHCGSRGVYMYHRNMLGCNPNAKMPDQEPHELANEHWCRRVCEAVYLSRHAFMTVLVQHTMHTIMSFCFIGADLGLEWVEGVGACTVHQFLWAVHTVCPPGDFHADFFLWPEGLVGSRKNRYHNGIFYLLDHANPVY